MAAGPGRPDSKATAAEEPWGGGGGAEAGKGVAWGLACQAKLVVEARMRRLLGARSVPCRDPGLRSGACFWDRAGKGSAPPPPMTQPRPCPVLSLANHSLALAPNSGGKLQLRA